MAYKLFVGSLPFSMGDNELEQLFAEYGKISSAKVIVDRDTNRSKGFGFVEFEDDEEGKTAEKAMSGKEVDGRKLTVNQARPREERPKRDFNSGGGSFRERSW